MTVAIFYYGKMLVLIAGVAWSAYYWPKPPPRPRPTHRRCRWTREESLRARKEGYLP
jgi:hypothetical protein